MRRGSFGGTLHQPIATLRGVAGPDPVLVGATRANPTRINRNATAIIGRVVQDGSRARVVDRPDQWWAVPDDAGQAK